MMRGEVYLARLDPVEGSEQGGVRPVVIVSRDSLNATRQHVVAVPFTTDRGKHTAPNHVHVASGDGGLRVNSVALTEHIRVLSNTRFGPRWGRIAGPTMARIEEGIRIALALLPPEYSPRS